MGVDRLRREARFVDKVLRTDDWRTSEERQEQGAEQGSKKRKKT
jgi:hypothetical protein